MSAHALLDRLLGAFGERYARGKRERSAVDFEDLELFTRALLARDPELRERYQARFAHVMVDELQDTNRVQLELIESVAGGNLFTVGDAQQSIYGFRHAEVELFERLADRLDAVGARATLQTNFRSRPEILEAINRTFADQLGERFMPLSRGGRGSPRPSRWSSWCVADKGAEWEIDGLGSPWRHAEARALAARVAELVAAGTRPRDVVVLSGRAPTCVSTSERSRIAGSPRT